MRSERTASRAYRHHHGRQRPLGRAASPAARGRTPGRHRRGARIVETSARLGIEVLTLYAFSVENWKRPAHRSQHAHGAAQALSAARAEHAAAATTSGFASSGGREDLAPDIQQELRCGDAAHGRRTRGMLFNIALNYGGRAEIVDAARRAIARASRADELDEERVQQLLYTAGQPDPDLLIRTSGEMRVSNFLLWQIAYAEIWVTDTFWPDFRAPPPARGDPRVPEAGAAIRRHRSRRAWQSAPSDARSSARCCCWLVIGGAAWCCAASPPLLLVAAAGRGAGVIELAHAGSACARRAASRGCPVVLPAALCASGRAGLPLPLAPVIVALLVAAGGALVVGAAADRDAPAGRRDLRSALHRAAAGRADRSCGGYGRAGGSC